MREYITKHAKIITTIGIVLMIVSFIIILFLTDYKQTTDKELQKRFIFCEGKSGKVEYDFVCSSSGECQKQYLFCDYLNFLRENKIVDLQQIDYEKMKTEFFRRTNVAQLNMSEMNEMTFNDTTTTK